MVADLTKSKARAKDRAGKLPPATTMRLELGSMRRHLGKGMLSIGICDGDAI